MPAPPSADIDRILDAIRAEAHARGSTAARIGGYSIELPAGAPIHVASHGVPMPELKHAADFLVLPLDVFIPAAYRQVLAREPDAAGAAHYQRQLLRGRLTRIEVLGRLAFSPEGRRRGRAVPGIGPAFALAMLYRVPLAGPLAALAARALGLPAHWQDRSRLEATAFASGAWMKR